MDKTESSNTCPPCTWVPAELVALITGNTGRMVRKVRNGKKFKRGVSHSKIKVVDRYLQEHFGIVIQNAKELSVLALPSNHRKTSNSSN